jgi:chromosome segregation ATPase
MIEEPMSQESENLILEMLREMRGDMAAIHAKVDRLDSKVDRTQADLASLKAKVDSWPGLHFLQDSIQRQQRDVLGFRDDMRVLTAIAMRLDTGHSLLLEELRATHTQIFRMNDRLRKLEDESAAPPL